MGFPSNHSYNLSENEIESRILRLEDDEVITGYTISVNTKKIRRRIIRVVLVRFKVSAASCKQD